MAGNLGDVLTRTDVYIDVDDIEFKRLFPTKASFGDASEARLDTIEEETAKVVFRLSEPADSAIVVYKALTGPDPAGTCAHTRALRDSVDEYDV